jgi:hypothetical protein
MFIPDFLGFGVSAFITPMTFVNVIMSYVSALNREFPQTTIPHTTESLKQVDRDKDYQIQPPRDFTFSTETAFDFH